MMRFDVDGDCWTADHDDILGWEILSDVLYKVGVRQVMVRRFRDERPEIRTVYVSDPLAELLGVKRRIEGTYAAAQTAIQHMIKTQLTREFSRIRREHLRRHWITLTDAMGLTYISVYAKEWSNAACITDQIIVLEARDREIPSWLDQLNRLQDWYCRMADLAKVSVELELPPLAAE